MSLVDTTPRLRMFAGPNGSGKSTIKSKLKLEWLGVYVNPDEIEAQIKRLTLIDFKQFAVKLSKSELEIFFQNSSLLQKFDLLEQAKQIEFSDNRITFDTIKINSYYASVISDLLRQSLIKSKQSFSFETVMSSPDKIDLLTLRGEFDKVKFS
jgi:predicted ABC-type ATPase